MNLDTRVNNRINHAKNLLKYYPFASKPPNEWSDKEFLKIRNSGIKTLGRFRELYPIIDDYDFWTLVTSKNLKGNNHGEE